MAERMTASVSSSVSEVDTQRHMVFKGERLNAFSDAVFAIVATIMVIPLKLSERDVEDFTYPNGEFILSEWLYSWAFFFKMFIYWFAFIVVIHFWYSHNKLSRLTEQFDDILAWLNLIYLLLISFLPATIKMVYNFPESETALAFNVGTIIAINLTMILSIFVAFRQKYLLHPDLVKLHGLAVLKVVTYLPLVISCLFGVLTIILSYAVDSSVGLPFFFCIPFGSLLIRTMTVYIYKKFTRNDIPSELKNSILKDVVSKERLIAFSDGVFSIVGTLLILDITTGEVPTSASAGSNEDAIKDFLQSNEYELITYLATFFIVGLLWFVHHSMFDYFKETTVIVTIFNSFSLLFVGLIPLGAGLISEFSEGNNTKNEVMSIQVFGVLLILASVSQLLLWSVAQYQSQTVLKDDISNLSQAVMLIKLLIFPIVGFLFYTVSFYEDIAIHHFFSILSLVTPIIFILPRVFLALKDLIFKKKKRGILETTPADKQQGVSINDKTVVGGPGEVVALLYDDKHEVPLQQVNEHSTKSTTNNEYDRAARADTDNLSKPLL